MALRFIRIGQHRLNLLHIVRWFPDGDNLVVVTSDLLRPAATATLHFGDPEGAIDRALCSAFYDCTPRTILR